MRAASMTCVGLALGVGAFALGGCAGRPGPDWRRMLAGAPIARGLSVPDAVTARDRRHLVADLNATNTDGTVNVVVEIPAGTVAKFEVDKTSGALAWELVDGTPRNVDFLGYPANYGYIPSTILHVLGLPQPEPWIGIPLKMLPNERDLLATLAENEGHAIYDAHGHHKWITIH